MFFLKVSGSLANIFHFTVIARNRIDASIRFNMLMSLKYVNYIYFL